MRIAIRLERISVRETLRYLMCTETAADARLLEQIETAHRMILESVEPLVTAQRFRFDRALRFSGTNFCAEGEAIRTFLAPCSEAYLFAATLGVQSERILLRTQASSSAQALVLDAALSAAIEQVCDQACEYLSAQLAAEELFTNGRFSPGYGDMPMSQGAEILRVLDAQKAIGLSVSCGGQMIPRKSVCALIGIADQKKNESRSGCAQCSMRDACMLNKERLCQSVKEG